MTSLSWRRRLLLLLMWLAGPPARAVAGLTCAANGSSVVDLWRQLTAGLGVFQQPSSPTSDYADFAELATVARHFSRQGMALSGHGRHREAAAALDQALEIYPAWSGHWNNAAVGRLRAGDGDAGGDTSSRLEAALDHDAANRLARGNLVLARAVSAMHKAGSWGVALGVVPPAGALWLPSCMPTIGRRCAC